jgi:4-hydroxy-tetrahydrodipicolinate reductase
MRVGVVGAGGRMGREVCRAVLSRSDLELVAAVDPAHVGTPLDELLGTGRTALVLAGEASALSGAGVEVVVDFTVASAARETLAACAGAGIHAVVGTTGFDPADLDALASWFAGPAQGAPNCVLAPNFAIGAVLMMRFAELAAPWFGGAEIVESHHDAKRDAPSGTALLTAERIASGRDATGRGPFPPDATEVEVLDGARGGVGPAGVRVHSVRLPGLVAHQEVVFGTAGQTLTIRHDSYDRVSFMDGVLLAVEAVPERPGLTVGLEPLLGL